MNDILRPTLELTVIIPGMILAYLPVKSTLKISLPKLIAWLFPLLFALCILGGILCSALQIKTAPILFFLLLFLLVIYHKTLAISIWKSFSIFLAICAVFSCVNSFSRAINAIIDLHIPASKNILWFQIGTGIIYNIICILFLLAVWYPATHTVRIMIDDDNFAQTWYVFWILPLIFIGLNLFMVPKYDGTLYTGRILQIYIVVSLVLLIILALFYALFLLMANSLNRNARLQQENYLLSIQQERYTNLCNAIEETRQARHDMHHHFLQLSSMAEAGDLEKIKEYLYNVTQKIPTLNMHFCENQVIDSVISYYCTLAERNTIPFHVQIDLPAQISVDETDFCLVLSNLLENALEASLKTAKFRQRIDIKIYRHASNLILIQIENAFDGKIQQKHGIFLSSKRNENGIGIQSVRHIVEKTGGGCDFTYDNGIFTAKIMLRPCINS